MFRFALVLVGGHFASVPLAGPWRSETAAGGSFGRWSGRSPLEGRPVVRCFLWAKAERHRCKITPNSLPERFTTTSIGSLQGSCGGDGKNRKYRVSCGGKRSPESESARRELSKSGLASHFGTQKCDFTGRGGGPLPEVLTVSSEMRCFRNGRQELWIVVVRLRTLHHTPGLGKEWRVQLSAPVPPCFAFLGGRTNIKSVRGARTAPFPKPHASLTVFARPPGVALPGGPPQSARRTPPGRVPHWGRIPGGHPPGVCANVVRLTCGFGERGGRGLQYTPLGNKKSLV
jgi:hypothetical protein